jgi:hypothetical protein
MKKIYIIIYLCIISQASIGQQRLIEYKKIAEREIQKHFEFPLSKTKCIVDSKIDIDGIEALFTKNYLIEENDTESFIKITLEYSIFITEINDWFPIYLTIDSNKVIDYKKTDFSLIPTCILKNKGCNFIKRDIAVLIAKKDSILYPKNIETFFWFDKKLGKCFWTVKGYPLKKSKTISKNQFRKIDALTGKIIK